MAAARIPSWVELLTLMVHGADPTVRGVIRNRDGTDGRVLVGWTAFAADPLPVATGAGGGPDDDGATVRRVWRDGVRARIEDGDGRITIIVGAEQCWRFDRAHDSPEVSPSDAVRYAGNGIELLARREPEAFAADDFTRPTNRPIGATTFLGRPAWAVELAPPQHKPHPIQLVVDAETGLVLQRRNDAFGTVAEWTEFVAGERFDPALFRWDGSSRSHTERRASRQAEFEAEESARRAWFEANVVGLPLTVEVAVGISVNEFDEATGAFQAGIGDGHVGALARRPASDAPWELGWAEVQHRWSDGSWDWAVTIFRDTLTPGGLKALRRQLAAGPT